MTLLIFSVSHLTGRERARSVEERRARASPGPRQMWRLLYLPGPIRRSCSKNKAPGLPFCSREIGSCSIPVKFKWDTCLLPAWPHKWAPAQSIRPCCLVSTAGVVAVVSVHVPVVTPRTAGILKPASWAWYHCSLLFLLPWKSLVGGEREPWGDLRRRSHLCCRLGFSKERQDDRHLAGWWKSAEELHRCKVSPEQVLERNEPDPCLWQKRWNLKWGNSPSRAHVTLPWFPLHLYHFHWGVTVTT